MERVAKCKRLQPCPQHFVDSGRGVATLFVPYPLARVNSYLQGAPGIPQSPWIGSETDDHASAIMISPSLTGVRGAAIVSSQAASSALPPSQQSELGGPVRRGAHMPSE